MKRTLWRRAGALAALPVLGAGVGVLAAGPAQAAPAGQWEAIMGHFPSTAAADAAAAKASAHGYRTVVQPIGPGNIEVELAAGMADGAAADGFCSQARAAGVFCSTEIEFHGIPAAWSEGPATTPVPPAATTPVPPAPAAPLPPVPAGPPAPPPAAAPLPPAVPGSGPSGSQGWSAPPARQPWWDSWGPTWGWSPSWSAGNGWW